MLFRSYSYMALVPLIQPPIMKALTTEKERTVRMEYPAKSVSRNLKIVFPIAVTVVTCLIAPMGTPLMGMLMLGNLMKESGVVARLTKASENEIANVVTLLLGLAIGATMDGAAFLKPQTLMILALGLLAIGLDTVMGVLFGKLMCFLTGGKVNPLIGAAGISLGLLLFGPRLIRLVGEQITKLNPMRAFCVALSAAVTVILASWLGLPVSSTHIAVGAVFGVGFFREWYTRNSKRRIEYMKMKADFWEIEDTRERNPDEMRRRYLVRRSHFMTIVAAWIITVPASAGLAALLYWIMFQLFL